MNSEPFVRASVAAMAKGRRALSASSRFAFRTLHLPVDRSGAFAFIVGCSHSGTTITLRCLAEHPDLFAIDRETGLFLRERGPWTIRRELRQWKQEARQVGESIVCEKTPNHLFHLEEIFSAIPRAKVIIVTRDGRDVAASLYRRTGDLEKAMEKWCRAAEVTRSWSRDRRVLNVRYESLVTHPAEYFDTIQRFLEIDVIPTLHDPDGEWVFENGSVPTSSPTRADGENHLLLRNWQINQGLFDGRNRWRETLSTEQGRLVAERLSPALVALDYSSDEGR